MFLNLNLKYCRKAHSTLEVWVLTSFVISTVSGVKNWQVKQDFNLFRIILKRWSFFRILKKLKGISNMKKKEELFILSELLLPLCPNKWIFWYFLTLQDNLLLFWKLQLKFLSKIFIERPVILLLIETETSTENKLQLVT